MVLVNGYSGIYDGQRHGATLGLTPAAWAAPT